MGGPGLFRELAELQRAGMPVKRSWFWSPSIPIAVVGVVVVEIVFGGATWAVVTYFMACMVLGAWVGWTGR